MIKDELHILYCNQNMLTKIIGQVKDLIQLSPLYRITNHNGKMGNTLISLDEDKLIKTGIAGIYRILLKCSNALVDLYIGESEVCIAQRVSRCVKQAKGENTVDEAHSAGQLLKNDFTNYQKEDVWKNNLFVQFIPLYILRKITRDIVIPVNPLFDDSDFKLYDFEDKSLLTFFEDKMISEFGPIGNKINKSTNRATRYINNLIHYNNFKNDITQRSMIYNG